MGKQVTDLTALASPDSADLIYIIDMSAGPEGKKITVANLLASAGGGSSEEEVDEAIEEAFDAIELKGSVKAAATGPVTLSGEQTLDGVACTLGDRVLAPFQEDARDNGLYVIGEYGWTRAEDMLPGSAAAATFGHIQQGTLHADKKWLCTNNTGGDIVGVSELAFAIGSAASGSGDTELPAVPTSGPSIEVTTLIEGTGGTAANEILSYTEAQLRAFSTVEEDGSYRINFRLSPTDYPDTGLDGFSGYIFTSPIGLTATAEELETLLDAALDIISAESGGGHVSVSRSGSAGSYEWTIEFIGFFASINLLNGTSGFARIHPLTIDHGTWLAPTVDQSGSSGPTDEVQVVEVTDAGGGTYAITYDGQTTAAIAHDASDAAVESALELLSNIDTVSVVRSVDGTTVRWEVTFGGSLAQTNVAQMTANGASLTGAFAVVDWSLSRLYRITLDGSTELFFDTGSPGLLALRLIQDGTGGHTVTWPDAVKWAGGTPPTLSTAADAIDVIQFYFDGTNYYGAVLGLDYQ